VKELYQGLYPEQGLGLNEHEKRLIESLIRQRFPDADQEYIESKIAAYCDDDSIMITAVPSKKQ